MSDQREVNRRVKMQAIHALLTEWNTRNANWTPAAQAAIVSFPVLASFYDSNHVVTCAKNLEALSEADRSLARDRLTLQDQDVYAALAEMPPMPNRTDRLRADAQIARLIRCIERTHRTNLHAI